MNYLIFAGGSREAIFGYEQSNTWKERREDTNFSLFFQYTRISYADCKIFRALTHFDNCMSVHRNIIPNYSQKDATCLYLFISTDALYVSGGSSAHHEERITVHAASGIVNRYCCC
jgi:hypothetical protein